MFYEKQNLWYLAFYGWLETVRFPDCGHPWAGSENEHEREEREFLL